MKLNHKRKAFTLMEMLIAILIIVLLISVTALSSVKMINTAEASRIIKSLYGLKKAVIAWRMAHLDWIQTDGQIKVNSKGEAGRIQNVNKNDAALRITKYVNAGSDFKLNTNGGNLTEIGTYGVFDAGAANKTTWYVGYCFADSKSEKYLTDIREKLRTQIQANKDVIFLGGKYPNFTISKGSETCVWLRVIGSWSPSNI